MRLLKFDFGISSNEQKGLFLFTTRWFSARLTALKKDGRIIKNEAIKVPEIILIDENNEKTGPFSPLTALSLMNRKTHDLVLVNPTANPPIAKLFSRSVQFQKQQNAQHAASILRLKQREKEVRFSSNIAPRDFELRMKKVYEFLGKAYKVKLVINQGKDQSSRRNPAAREHTNKSILDRLRKDMGKDLIIMGPPESLVGNLTTVVYSDSASPPSRIEKKSLLSKSFLDADSDSDTGDNDDQQSSKSSDKK